MRARRLTCASEPPSPACRRAGRCWLALNATGRSGAGLAGQACRVPAGCALPACRPAPSPAVPAAPAVQTLLLQNKFDWSEYAQDGRVMLRYRWPGRLLLAGAGLRCHSLEEACAPLPPTLLPDSQGPAPAPTHPPRSYGPCQFPTLGLIVQRWWEIQAHVPEDFWYIQVHPGLPTCRVARGGSARQQLLPGAAGRAPPRRCAPYAPSRSPLASLLPLSCCTATVPRPASSSGTASACTARPPLPCCTRCALPRRWPPWLR